MMPSDRLVLAHRSPAVKPVVVIGPVDVVLDVLLPAPDDFHRPVDLLGDRDGLGDAVDVQPAAEAAADQMIVHLDLLRRQSGDLRGRGLRAADHLISDPDVAAVFAYMHRAVHRLHRGMGQERHLVHRLDLLGGAGQRLGDVAVVCGDDACLLRRALHLLTMSAVVTFAFGPSSHSMSSAARPCIAAHM